MTAPRCLWCGENHPTELIRIWGDLATTCPRLGANEAVMFAPAHRITPADFEALTKVEEKISSSDRKAAELREELGLDPVAMARTTDGSPVVAHAPAGLETRAFGAEDLDARGMPRWRP